jgi:hypothetical protein
MAKAALPTLHAAVHHTPVSRPSGCYALAVERGALSPSIACTAQQPCVGKSAGEAAMQQQHQCLLPGEAAAQPCVDTQALAGSGCKHTGAPAGQQAAEAGHLPEFRTAGASGCSSSEGAHCSARRARCGDPVGMTGRGCEQSPYSLQQGRAPGQPTDASTPGHSSPSHQLMQESGHMGNTGVAAVSCMSQVPSSQHILS